MAVIEMHKIRVYAPVSETESLYKILQDFGASALAADVPETTTVGEETDFSTRQKLARLDMATNFLKPYVKGDFLRGAFEGGRAHTSASELAKLASSYDAEEAISDVERLQAALAESDRNKKKYEQELRTIREWVRLELPLNEISETAQTFTLALRGPERIINKFSARAESEMSEAISLQNVSETTILLTALKDARERLEEIVSTSGLEVVKLPNAEHTAAEEMTRVEAALAASVSDHEIIETQITKLAGSEFSNLQKASDLALWEHERNAATQTTARTERLSVITAWIPKRDHASLEKNIYETLSASAIEVLDHGEEKPPTELANNSHTKPFETITRLYGVPAYKDLDPTPQLAPFFFVFFAMCLSDVGYGSTLMLLTGLVLWKYHLEAGTKQLLSLLFIGGFGSFFAGILFGGYLGVDPSSIHPALAKVQVFDPISDPLPVFYLSLALGFIHISYGVFLNLVRQYKLGETKDAILDNGPWLLVFISIALAVLNATGYLSGNLNLFLDNHVSNLFIGLALLLVLTQGRKEKNIFSKLLFGVLSLYNGVGYFADVLSYSRLLALGLATGALGFSINLIAEFVGGATPYIGPLVMAIILFLGHTLNITISVLGAFINSARLQFVEFFSKFSTDTGRVYVPFRKTERNVIILPDPPSSK
ncbi:hypothetical protein KC926_03200 [Candidatus Kaiserbacteria bacterium]|nr:hypothetical protein [Candidatus Kaiserbacteria bacterium]